MEITAARTLNALYIYLDILWLVIFALVLLWHKRYLALIWGLIGGVIYFVADYGRDQSGDALSLPHPQGCFPPI
jgi:hypothetical protein